MTRWLISPYFNEAEVFEIRLAELGDWADVIVVAEGNRTYAGTEREYEFPKEEQRWKPWEEKIRYLQVDLPLFQDFEGRMAMQPFHSCISGPWLREQALRQSLVTAMRDLDDNDVVLMSDADEIVRREVAERMQHDIFKTPVLSFALPQHVMYLNWRWPAEVGAVARFVSGATLRRDGMETIVRGGGYPLVHGQDHGWHFAYMGGLERILYKIRQAAHTELRDWATTTNVSHSLLTGQDIFGRYEHQAYSVPLSDLPAHVQQNPERFGLLLGHELAPGGVLVP